MRIGKLVIFVLRTLIQECLDGYRGLKMTPLQQLRFFSTDKVKNLLQILEETPNELRSVSPGGTEDEAGMSTLRAVVFVKMRQTAEILAGLLNAAASLDPRLENLKVRKCVLL